MNYLISRTIYVLKKRQFSWVRLVLFILLISPSLLGQISISIQKQTLRQALKAIERSGNYQFFYNEDLSSLDKVVSLSVKDAPIEDVLDKLLYGTDITYKKEKENLIVLTCCSEARESDCKRDRCRCCRRTCYWGKCGGKRNNKRYSN